MPDDLDADRLRTDAPFQSPGVASIPDDFDADLLRRWRSGDHDAYATLVSRHYGVVLTACLRQAAPGEGEDCTQAVFLVLARRPESAARAPVLTAWFLRVATYVCSNSRRDAQRRRQAEHRAGSETGRQVVTQRQPEALDHLDACLLKLPERQRCAVTLHYLCDRNPQEVAAIMRVSRDNAYQLISRGLSALRALLAKRGVALSSAALINLCASQAQAATASASAAVLASLSSTTPSLGVVHLAQGAMTTMTITAFKPLAVAALVCVSGMLTLLVSADAQPDPADGGMATPPVTFEFQDIDMSSALALLRNQSGQTILLDPSVDITSLPPLTITVEGMQLRHALEYIAKLTGLTCSPRDGGYLLHL